MKQAQTILSMRTKGRGLTEITRDVDIWLQKQDISRGLLTMFVQHTSASLLVQENADPDVLRDLENFFRRLVPEGRDIYHHSMEGKDDMPAHIRSALTSTQLSVPVMNGSLALGTWQGIYLYEHREASHSRKIALHLMGEE